MPSDLIRGWVPVRVKKTRQTKDLGQARSRHALFHVFAVFLELAIVA